MKQSSKDAEVRQEELTEARLEELREEVGAKCFGYLRPFLQTLDTHLDVRLVRTLAHLVPAILKRRNSPEALLLSQLGDELEREGHGPAGTKRIGNLLTSEHWRAEEIGEYLLEQAKELIRSEAARVPEKRALCIVDGSVREKSESAQLEGLAPINSAKARRLRRPRPKLGPGYYRGPLGPPTVVPGFHWASLVLTGWEERTAQRPVGLGGWLFYRRVARTHPDHQEIDAPIPTADQATALHFLLTHFLEAVDRDHLLFVGDREFANTPWLTSLIRQKLPFVVRWKKGNHLRPEDASSVKDPLISPTQRRQEGRPAWKITQKLLFRQQRTIFNPRNPQQSLSVRFGVDPVRLVEDEEPLWLVWVKLGKGGRRRREGEPWRLLTNLPLETQEDVWRVVQAYAARWQIEQSIRLTKSQLGIQSVRVQKWDVRAKLLAIVALAYAFLVWFLGDLTSPLVHDVLQIIHRTGRQANEVWRPIYRFLQALAKLWKVHTPTFQGIP